MILFLVLAKMQDYGYEIHITAWFIPIYFMIVLIMMFLGYLEDKVGLYREESRAAGSRNPYFKEIIDRLTKIEKDLSDIKKKK